MSIEQHSCRFSKSGSVCLRSFPAAIVVSAEFPYREMACFQVVQWRTGQERAIIIGAGPAGLTAAYELLHKTNIKPIILESTSDVGGISKTVKYKGNRIDIGGHRFFSKSNRVMQWWQHIMPVQANPAGANEGGPVPEKTDLVLLIRSRLSRILFLRKFFDYPITLSPNTVRNLGFVRILKMALSYAGSACFRRGKCVLWRIFLFIDLAGNCIEHFSGIIRKRCGASPATKLGLNGERRGSRDSLS